MLTIDSGSLDIVGYVGKDDSKKQIMLVFRGSKSIGNVVADAEFAFANCSSCPGCQVHAGFQQGWHVVKDGVMATIKEAMSANPGYEVTATGHSLGSGIATLATADLRNEGIPTTLVRNHLSLDFIMHLLTDYYSSLYLVLRGLVIRHLSTM